MRAGNPRFLVSDARCVRHRRDTTCSASGQRSLLLIIFRIVQQANPWVEALAISILFLIFSNLRMPMFTITDIMFPIVLPYIDNVNCKVYKCFSWGGYKLTKNIRPRGEDIRAYILQNIEK